MLNENNLGTEEPNFRYKDLGKNEDNLNYVGFSLYKNDSILDRTSTSIDNACGSYSEAMRIQEIDSIVYKFLRKYSIQTKYELRYVNHTDNSLQGYYLQPGEIKYFTSIVNLPHRNDQKWLSNIQNKKPNLACISLRNDLFLTRRMITENQIREIQENGYILFEGVVYSNKVPVELITIKK